MSDQETSPGSVLTKNGPNIRKRSSPGGQAKGQGSGNNSIKSSSVNANGDNMWKFYSEDSPGVKIGPVPVLVISLMFIGSVFIMHIWGKYTRVSNSTAGNAPPTDAPPTVDD